MCIHTCMFICVYMLLCMCVHECMRVCVLVMVCTGTCACVCCICVDMQTAHIPDYVINKNQDFIKLNNHFLVCVFFTLISSEREREDGKRERVY